MESIKDKLIPFVPAAIRPFIYLDKERIKFGSENSRTFSQVKRIEDKGDYQRLVYRPFLNLNSLANRLTGFKRSVIRVLSVLIGVFTKEARNEIFRDLMYYQVLKKSSNKFIDIFYWSRNE